jgi:nucleotide-binding universal stress UspA family protein
MKGLGNRMLASDTAPGSDTDMSAKPVFRRVLVAVKDESQIEHAVEVALRAGASEARVLHLNLRENFGGRRYTLETESSAAGLVEAAVLELRMAGIAASGQVRHALIDRAAEAIAADATEWAADLIVLGVPHRSKLATRLFGSITLRVLQHAPCPVVVASAAGNDRLHRLEQSASSATGPDLDAGDRTRNGSLQATGQA